MQTRRSFFSRLGALVAVVAMAPEIAFSARLDIQQKLNLEEFFQSVYAIARARSHQPQIDIFTDRAGLDALYGATGAPELANLFTEPLDMKVCGHSVGVYEQLRACRA